MMTSDIGWWGQQCRSCQYRAHCPAESGQRHYGWNGCNPTQRGAISHRHALQLNQNITDDVSLNVKWIV
jgi:hypothetical protein